MDFLKDWKFWMFVLSGLHSILIIAGTMLLKFNDFKHLHAEVKNMDEKLDEIDKKLDKTTERVANLEGQIN